jgi:hypothetical protein
LFLLEERKGEQKQVQVIFLFSRILFGLCRRKGSPRYDFGKVMAVRNYGKYNSEAKN